MSKLSEMMDSLAPAKTPDGFFINQMLWDRTISILSQLVEQYDSMPDGQLGRGLTNGPFIEARNLLKEVK